MDVKLIGQQFSALLRSFFPPLSNSDIRASLHVFGISLWLRKALTIASQLPLFHLRSPLAFLLEFCIVHLLCIPLNHQEASILHL